MVKRCLVAVSAVLILIPVLCFSVFADSWTLVTDSHVTPFFGDNGSVYVDGGVSYGYSSDENGWTLTARFGNNPIKVRIVNNSSLTLMFDVKFQYAGISSNLADNSTVFIEPHSDFVITFSNPITGSFPICYFSNIEFFSNYSVWDTTPLFPIISSLYTFISGNTVLVVLFFIGVTVSLGFVAIRFIRKTMWGN